jgi:hypothetical protein
MTKTGMAQCPAGQFSTQNQSAGRAYPFLPFLAGLVALAFLPLASAGADLPLASGFAPCPACAGVSGRGCAGGLFCAATDALAAAMTVANISEISFPIIDPFLFIRDNRIEGLRVHNVAAEEPVDQASG